ncbi:MAG TPA: alpha/beta hydrolase [Pseudonocardia sp.]|nr:alpha/beta hydrolase [Pseudonocardia sp.]
MGRSTAVDGFELAYDRVGGGPPVLLLHGWPGDRTDYRELAPLLVDAADVVVPDLRGFGESDKPATAPVEQYSGPAQARSVAGLIEELGLVRPVVVGYDVGSRVAQALVRTRPDLVGALVVAPPLPGIGRRVLDQQAIREFWYQPFHQLPLSAQLIDGNSRAVHDYLAHFWAHWSGPDFTLPATALEHLVAVYSPPGAFTASINWYRAGAGAVATSLAETAPAADERIDTPTTVLWPEHDPLFPRAWSDRLGEFFADVTLRPADGVGHFSPLEAPRLFAAEVRAALDGLG